MCLRLLNSGVLAPAFASGGLTPRGGAPVLEFRARQSLEVRTGDLDSGLEDRVAAGSRITRISSSRPAREFWEGRQGDSDAAADMCTRVPMREGVCVFGGECVLFMCVCLFIERTSPLASTKPSTRKPARLAII